MEINWRLVLDLFLPLLWRLGLLVCLLILSIQLAAQNKTQLGVKNYEVRTIARNSVNFELGGNGFIYTLNYDRLFFQSDYYKSGIRVGFGVLPLASQIEESGRAVVFIPIEYNSLFGLKKHHLEVSVGVTYTTFVPGSEFWITGRVGYRIQGENGGFFFRAGMVLMYLPYANALYWTSPTNDIIFPMPAVAWGFSIK
jgi:hypothetical protein